MKHLGDITKLDGGKIPVVDCITGGSPCQDLSIAGKRAGLDGERSGLFLEQVRLVKEMREHDRATGRTDELIRPRYMVWENVAGAFSSNEGKDFQSVLTEIVRIAEPGAPDVPMPEKGRWQHSGCLYDEVGKWSVAWRLHDAQFWGTTQYVDGRVYTRGTPQRRKRIALVADFNGDSAAEILFERKGLRGDIEPCGTPWESAAGNPAEGVGEAGVSVLNDQGGSCMSVTEDVTATLRASEHGHQPMIAAGFDGNMGSKAGSIGYEEEKAPTLNAGKQMDVVQLATPAYSFQERVGKPGGGKGLLVSDERTGALSTSARAVAYGTEPCNVFGSTVTATLTSSATQAVGNTQDGLCAVVSTDTYHITNEADRAQTLKARDYKDPQIVTYRKAGHAMTKDDGQGWAETECNDTLNAFDNSEMRTPTLAVSYGIDRAAYNCGKNAKFGIGIDEEKIGTQSAKGPGAVYQTVVRRLMPIECERLQGFPDNWTDIGDWVDSNGKVHKASDAPRYKALGNSIALPFWFFLLRRISAQYERPATLGSLFDGIGGFPYCWEQFNGKGPAVWASEIEEFPIAVTKKRFPERGAEEYGYAAEGICCEDRTNGGRGNADEVEEAEE